MVLAGANSGRGDGVEGVDDCGFGDDVPYSLKSASKVTRTSYDSGGRFCSTFPPLPEEGDEPQPIVEIKKSQ